MCDPASMILGAVGAIGVKTVYKALTPGQSSQQTQTDPAAERAAAEAEAQQTANRRLAEDQRRRREQQSLLAKGAPQPTFGDATASADPISPIGTSNRSTTARAGSLMSRGAVATSAASPTAYGGSGGAGRVQVSML